MPVLMTLLMLAAAAAGSSDDVIPIVRMEPPPFVRVKPFSWVSIGPDNHGARWWYDTANRSVSQTKESKDVSVWVRIDKHGSSNYLLAEIFCDYGQYAFQGRYSDTGRRLDSFSTEYAKASPGTIGGELVRQSCGH